MLRTYPPWLLFVKRPTLPSSSTYAVVREGITPAASLLIGPVSKTPLR